MFFTFWRRWLTATRHVVLSSFCFMLIIVWRGMYGCFHIDNWHAFVTHAQWNIPDLLSLFMNLIWTGLFASDYCCCLNIVLLGKQAHSTWNCFQSSSPTCCCASTRPIRNRYFGVRATASNEQDGRSSCCVDASPSTASS